MNGATTERERLAYLNALGVQVWQERGRQLPDEAAVECAEAELPADAGPVADGVLRTGAPDVHPPADWPSLKSAVAKCTRCSLHKTRTQTVFGVGSETADWMIIGEAPGAEEDRRGEPFVGRAGKLLDEMLRAVGLDRQTVYIANILKCRPPNNRDPSVDESSQCRGYLDRQIELIRPKIILAVGRIAAQQLLGSDSPLGRLRGQVHAVGDAAIPTLVTYHPAYLLRSPTQKRKVWQDLCMARSAMEQRPQ